MGSPQGSTPRHFLHPSTLFSDRAEHLVSTVLGSCVSVCLWDPTLGVGGMNHYMLPLWNGQGLPTPKYGNVAIHKLLERMGQLGCDRNRLVAKVFGGADVLGHTRALMPIGERNIEVARELLAQHRVQIIAGNTGGNQGRKITFNTHSGVVLVGALPPGTQL